MRSDIGYSARRLSLEAGLAAGAVHALERELNTPALDTVERLAAALGIPACWLAFGAFGPQVFRKKLPRGTSQPDPPVPSPGSAGFLERYKGVGQRLRQRREEKGVSLRGLAEGVGMSLQSIVNTESGATVPKLDSLERLASELGVSPCWLAFGTVEAD